MLSSQDLLTLTKAEISRIGLTPSDSEVDEGYVIVRIRHHNGSFIGAVTIPPSWERCSEDAATRLIRAHVLEACRAAMKEPAARG